MQKHNDTLAKIDLSLTEVRRNIRKVFSQASPEDIMAGEHWYDEAQAIGQEIAGITGKSLDHAAVAIAHLAAIRTTRIDVRHNRLNNDLIEQHFAYF